VNFVNVISLVSVTNGLTFFSVCYTGFNQPRNHQLLKKDLLYKVDSLSPPFILVICFV